ncbi:MAG: hypothetical protein ACOY4K_00720 [Pseudomonadota bacterium]
MIAPRIQKEPQMTKAPETAKSAEPVSPLAKLREPFPPHQISKLPKPLKKDAQKGRCDECGGYHGLPAIHLDYVGHAALTDRLLDVDPHWSWEPVAEPASHGLPVAPGGMWIRLTVCGVTRYGFGHPDGKTGGDAVKETIGDALRNAAMRFGAALDLWHKGDLHAAEDDDADDKAKTPPAPEARKGPTLAERAARLERALTDAPSRDALRHAFELGTGLRADLDRSDPERLVEIEATYHRRFAELEAEAA